MSQHERGHDWARQKLTWDHLPQPENSGFNPENEFHLDMLVGASKKRRDNPAKTIITKLINLDFFEGFWGCVSI